MHPATSAHVLQWERSGSSGGFIPALGRGRGQPWRRRCIPAIVLSWWGNREKRGGETRGRRHRTEEGGGEWRLGFGRREQGAAKKEGEWLKVHMGAPWLHGRKVGTTLSCRMEEEEKGLGWLSKR